MAAREVADGGLIAGHPAKPADSRARAPQQVFAKDLAKPRRAYQ
jgi:hypothetical protein